MKIAFPSNENKGLESSVFNHFGTAKIFVIVETETGKTEIVNNQDLNHSHNQCQPLKALGETKIDAVAVGGIGGGALQKLKASGIKVYKSEEGTVLENLEMYKAGKLNEFIPANVCGAHGPNGKCNH